jgi:threonine synthase
MSDEAPKNKTAAEQVDAGQPPSSHQRPGFQIQCVDCGKSFPRIFRPFCDECGGMTDTVYDLDQVKIRDSPNPYVRFQDLLPIHDVGLLPQDGHTTSTVHAKKLGAKLGIPKLYLKNETELPSRTTKDRMAAVSMAYLYECGVESFCTSSTGNSSTAYAKAVSRFPSLKMYLFSGADFHHRVQYEPNDQIVHYVLRDASFVDAFLYAGKFAQKNGLVSESGFFNPGRREGLKLTLMEAMDQVPEPIDWYVQAISSAMGVLGAYNGAKELHRMGRIPHTPHLLCVQQETCSPMVSAWESGSDCIGPEHIVKSPTGIAESILRGDPTKAYPIIKNIVEESEGAFAAVSEQEIRDARRMVEDLEGISPCFSASTAVAGVIKLVGQGKFPLNDTVLINLTGGDRQPNPAQESASDLRWLTRTEDGWMPEDPAGEEGIIHGD